MTLADTAVATADTKTTEATSESAQESSELSPGSSELSSEPTESDRDDDADGEKGEEKPSDEFSELSSQAIEDSAGPFAPLLKSIMRMFTNLSSMLDNIFGVISVIAGPALAGHYSIAK